MPKVTYLSHSGFLLESNGTKILIDPFLTNNPLAKTKPESVKANFVLLSHAQQDQLQDTINIAKANQATVVAPLELARFLERQGVKCHPMQVGGAYTFPFGRVKLTFAHHSSSFTEDDKPAIFLGNACGFLITLDGKNIYFAGDTGLFYDMQLLGQLQKIHMALLPIGGNFTMDIEDAVKAVEFLSPELAVPMHYNTFDSIRANPEEFVSRVRDLGFRAKSLDVNESVDF
jgi:L-ascorbate metabolism protein UlaG (beta-lactamase superfamily)